MARCYVVGCKSRAERCENTTFHHFPKKPHLRKAWVVATGRVNKNCVKARVCSKHFADECFKESKKSLVPGAVPTLFVKTQPPPVPAKPFVTLLTLATAAVVGHIRTSASTLTTSARPDDQTAQRSSLVNGRDATPPSTLTTSSILEHNKAPYSISISDIPRPIGSPPSFLPFTIPGDITASTVPTSTRPVLRSTLKKFSRPSRTGQYSVPFSAIAPYSAVPTSTRPAHNRALPPTLTSSARSGHNTAPYSVPFSATAPYSAASTFALPRHNRPLPPTLSSFSTAGHNTAPDPTIPVSAIAPYSTVPISTRPPRLNRALPPTFTSFSTAAQNTAPYATIPVSTTTFTMPGHSRVPYATFPMSTTAPTSTLATSGIPAPYPTTTDTSAIEEDNTVPTSTVSTQQPQRSTRSVHHILRNRFLASDADTRNVLIELHKSLKLKNIQEQRKMRQNYFERLHKLRMERNKNMGPKY